MSARLPLRAAIGGAALLNGSISPEKEVASGASHPRKPTGCKALSAPIV